MEYESSETADAFVVVAEAKDCPTNIDDKLKVCVIEEASDCHQVEETAVLLDNSASCQSNYLVTASAELAHTSVDCKAETSPTAKPKLDDNAQSDNTNKEPLSLELQQADRILREIMSDSNKSLIWPFVGAVDATEDGLEDYYEKIKEPMWLEKSKYLSKTSITL